MTDKQDLVKIKDIMERLVTFHKKRDEMNAELHLAKEVRYSPLTIQAMAELDRLTNLLNA